MLLPLVGLIKTSSSHIVESSYVRPSEEDLVGSTHIPGLHNCKKSTEENMYLDMCVPLLKKLLDNPISPSLKCLPIHTAIYKTRFSACLMTDFLNCFSWCIFHYSKQCIHSVSISEHFPLERGNIGWCIGLKIIITSQNNYGFGSRFFFVYC